MVKAVVFDLDHTLFDRYKTLELVVPMLREKLNTAPDVTDKHFAEQLIRLDKNLVHKGWEDIFAHLVAEGLLSADTEYKTYHTSLLECFTRVAVPFDFTVPMLNKLRSAGLKTGIITNGRHDVQASKFKMLGYDEKLFDVLVISGDTDYNKPQKEIFELTAERLGICTGEMMYVGDNPYADIYGSRNAGCVPVWVKTTGTWIYPEIEKPALQVETVAEIPQIVSELNAQ